MSAPSRPTVPLLDPLNEHQQRLVELVAGAFIADEGRWPIFDYVEGELDVEAIDAWSLMESFPRHPRGYAAIWWPRSPGTKPTPDTPVALTVVGIHHSESMQTLQPPLVPTFFALLKYLSEWRRSLPTALREPRNVEVASDEVIGALSDRGLQVDLLPPRLLYDLMDHEPATWSMGGSLASDEMSWKRGVPRILFLFENIDTIDSMWSKHSRHLSSRWQRPRQQHLRLWDLSPRSTISTRW